MVPFVLFLVMPMIPVNAACTLIPPADQRTSCDTCRSATGVPLSCALVVYPVERSTYIAGAEPTAGRRRWSTTSA